MKTISPNAVPPVKMIGNCIEVSLLRKRMMERSIKHRDLRQIFAEQIARGHDPLNIFRIVQWRQIDAVLDPLQHLVVDQRRFFEHFAAVHNAVAYGVYVRRAFYFGHA